jgi:hypothetical protein
VCWPFHDDHTVVWLISLYFAAPQNSYLQSYTCRRFFLSQIHTRPKLPSTYRDMTRMPGCVCTVAISSTTAPTYVCDGTICTNFRVYNSRSVTTSIVVLLSKAYLHHYHQELQTIHRHPDIHWSVVGTFLQFSLLPDPQIRPPQELKSKVDYERKFHPDEVWTLN